MPKNKNWVLESMREDDLKHDPWGTAMAWGFSVAELLTVLGADIPALDYRPSPFVAVEAFVDFIPESHSDNEVYEYLRACDDVFQLEHAITQLQFACKCLKRYLDWCEEAGRSY